MIPCHSGSWGTTAEAPDRRKIFFPTSSWHSAVAARSISNSRTLKNIQANKNSKITLRWLLIFIEHHLLSRSQLVYSLPTGRDDVWKENNKETPSMRTSLARCRMAWSAFASCDTLASTNPPVRSPFYRLEDKWGCFRSCRPLPKRPQLWKPLAQQALLQRCGANIESQDTSFRRRKVGSHSPDRA